MTEDRRYSEREIALILEQASAAQDVTKRDAEPGVGLTLRELQEIGGEIGIPPELVTRAARAVDRGDLVPTAKRTYLGLPIGVSRTIDFGRRVSDDEWEQLVVVLRETFEARGKVQEHGSFRQWTNGNLQALLEPTPTGHRLRLITRKGNAKALVSLGVFAVAGALAMTVLPGQNSAALVAPAVIWSVVGLGALVAAAIQLPLWARTRASQMEAIAAQALTDRELPAG
jgi:hypothetical protein